MIYAGDPGVRLPIKDLYDTQVMAMSIAAAKDMYEKGLKRLDDFYNKYGDFASPIQKDMDWYELNVTGRVRDTINNLYANGIDPLRSAEGRAAVALLIYSMPTGLIAQLRQSADVAKEYIKNRGILEASGKWDPNFERFANQGNTLEDWDTINNGVWSRTSPAELKTLKELTESWYNQRTPHTLDKAGVESFNMKYDPRYEYTGFTELDLLDIAAGQTPGWNGSVYSDYYRDLASRKVLMLKNLVGDYSPVTDTDIERQLQKDIAVANREYKISPQKKADQFAIIQQEHNNRVALENLSHKHAMQRAASSGSNGSGKGRLNVPVIFREAAARPGAEVNYDVDQSPHYQWIDPLVQGARAVKGTKGNYGYTIPASSMSSIYKKGQYNPDGTRISAQWDYGFSMSDATFIPTGQMRMEIDFVGQPHYYITGTLANNSTGREVVGRNGTELYEMEVTERAYNYGKKQATAYQPDN